MKYEIQRLDGRFTYRDLFQYTIKWPNRMSNRQGPINFTRVQKWFSDTYGWSAEVRQYADIRSWVETNNRFMKGQAVEMPEECSKHWSWTNGYEDLRIYVATDRELNFFQLRWPNEP